MGKLPELTPEQLWSFQHVYQGPDFNKIALNGDDPEAVQRERGVYVEVLGEIDPVVHAYPILIAGNSGKDIGDYLKHLQSTWPKVAGQRDNEKAAG